MTPRVGVPGASSFKSKRPLAVIATPDLELWAQLGPMLESTCQLRHADSLATAATMLKAGTRTILVADLRGQNPEDFAPISASPHNPVVIAIRDSASAGMVDALMLEGAIQALVDSPVEAAPMLRAINDAARISSTADALSAVTAPSSSSGGEEKSGKSPVMHDRHRRRGACRCGRRLVLHVQRFFRPDAGCCRYVARLPLLRPPGKPSSTAATAPAASLDEVLEKARLAMDERRYIEPAKNNALEHFRTVLQLEPGNAEATEGLKRLGGLLIARARTALDERRFDNALAELEAARSIDPNDAAPRRSRRAPRLPCAPRLRSRRFRRRSPRRTSIARRRCSKPRRKMRCCRPRRSRSCPRISTTSVAPSSSTAWWRAPSRALSSGRLVTPTDESAKDAIKALREAGASAEVVTRLNNDLNQRLLAAARDAAAKGDQAGMQAMLAAARDNGVSASALNAAQRDVTAAAQKQQRTTEDIARFAKAAQDRLASGNLLAPANDSAVSNAERLRLLDVRHPTTVQVVRDVRARLLTEARSRLAANRPAEAAALLDAAESLGGDSDLGELRAALANAQQAAATAAAAPKLPPLKMTRPPRPKYPASAKGVEGWVRVEFYVTPEGRTERVRVLSSEPAGLFDAAAISAMEGARFEEFDSTDARLAVQRIVFKPE